MTAEVDPFDIVTLEKSVNDSAASVSTVWASYILFGLYLVLTAGSVTQRQLLLENPVRLPVLNIDLPLVGFFVVAPVLFVIFHGYVLMQAVMLARTAAIYNQAMASKISITSDRIRLRLRLANNLFAQIFAGALRKGEGFIGWLFRQVAWLTLGFAPLAVLATFQYKFLPYHSSHVTWTHRILALLASVSVLFFCLGLLAAGRQSGRTETLARWKILSFGLTLISVFIVFNGILLSFPGERQATWARYLPEEAKFGPGQEDCRTTNWLGAFVDESFDRIALPNEVIIDDTKLSSVDEIRTSSAQRSSPGDRTRKFRNRDFRCASFQGADLRKADFTGSDLSGSNFVASNIGGARFDSASLKKADLTSSFADGASFWLTNLSSANLESAHLNGANFQGALLEQAVVVLAQLQNANFSASWLRDALLSGADIRGGKFVGAQLQGTNFRAANLQGASFRAARLQGAVFVEADVRGGDLRDANAQGATFLLADLQDADLGRAQLQGASFVRTALQGADLTLSQLQGAVFYQTQLQGANFGYAGMELVYMLEPFLWHSVVRNCDNATITDPQLDSIVGVKFPPSGRGEQIGSDPESVRAFIKDSGRTMPDGIRESFEALLRERLASDPLDQSVELWRACTAKSVADDAFQKKFAEYLVDMACHSQIDSRSYVGRGILQIWTSTGFLAIRRVASYISSGLTDSQNQSCAISNGSAPENGGSKRAP